MVYSFRALRAADVAAIRAMLTMMGDAFGDSSTYLQRQPGDAYLAQLLAKDHFIAVAAFAEGGGIVGGLTAYVLDKFEQDRREIYIYDLAVLESHRRRGIATGMIQALQTVAADRDAYVIFVQADLDDGPAIGLYRSLAEDEIIAHHFDIPVSRTRT